MRRTHAAAAIIIVIALLSAIAATASPGNLDKFGCHKCVENCDKYGLLANEFHCHGTANTQSLGIQQAPRIYDNLTYRRVARVIDGDTLAVYIGGKQQIVRLLGIDAPETSPIEKRACYGTTATQQLSRLAGNKFILLTKDKLQRDDKDKYGRLLRYITTLGNTTTVNEQLVQGGYAKAYPSLTSTTELYKKLELDAKNKKAGMWGECFREPKNETLNRLFPLKGEKIKR